MAGEFILKKAEKWRDGEDAVCRMQMTGMIVNKVPSEGRNPTSVILNALKQVWIRLRRREN